MVLAGQPDLAAFGGVNLRVVPQQAIGRLGSAALAGADQLANRIWGWVNHGSLSVRGSWWAPWPSSAKVNTGFRDRRYDQRMPDTPPSGPPPAAPSSGPTPAAGPIELPPRSRPSRLPTVTSLASLMLALVAVGIAVAAWLRPVPVQRPAAAAAAPVYTAEEVAQAKTNVCEAFALVKSAVVKNNDRPNPSPGEPTGALAAIANGRLALYAGGDYLLERVNAAPAAPTQITTQLRSLAHELKDFGMAFLAEVPDSELTPFRHSVDATFSILDRLCR